MYPLQKPPTFASLSAFISKTRDLLTKEQEAEKQYFEEMINCKSITEIEEEGAGLSNMVVLHSKEGFYDRIILTLVKSYHSDKNRIPIPEVCKLSNGDDVAIYSGDKMVAEGIIYRRSTDKIKITIKIDPEDNQDFEEMKLNVILKWNEVTYRRYFQILNALENPQEDIQLSHIFFPDSSRGYNHKQIKSDIPLFPKLNYEQSVAIANGLAQPCHLIHGPPGTGKTTTVCQLIVEAVKKGEKVLACAPSNIAVDNIVEGIAGKVNCIRVGNPARVIQDVIERCLDFLISRSEGIWKNEEKRLNAAQKKLKRTKVKSERKEIYAEMKEIRTEIKNLQEQIIAEIISEAEVICCTNVGAADKIFRRYLPNRKFDLVVIDECGQGLEVSCWIPISKAKRVVLAGDHKQLPPTVKFQSESLLSYTLFSRCMEELPYLTSTMLKIQYRMNRQIMGWSNSQFYNGQLEAHESVANHRLDGIYSEVDMDHIGGESNENVLIWIDTAGCQIGEEGGQMESKMNLGEVDLVAHLFKKLNQFGVKSKDIAILTPYSKQVSTIKNKLSEFQVDQPEISTIDGIQGREKECIIISLVRSNPEGEIGFLKDWRRINVAVTRARRMLILIGDTDCVVNDEKIKTLFEWVEENGVVRSAEEFRGDENIRFGLGRICDGENMKKKRENKENEKGEKEDDRKAKDKNHKKEKAQQKKKEEGKSVKEAEKKTHSVQEEEDLRNKYRKELKNLKEEVFYENLNAYERKMMHEVAEEYSHEHITSEDKSRITIKPIKYFKELEQKKMKEEQKRKQKEAKRNEPKGPQNLKELIGVQSSEEEEVIETEEPKEKVEEVNIPVKQKKKKNKVKEEVQEEEEDWEKIMAQYESEAPKQNECRKCTKKITSVTSIQCRFCKYFFCRHDVLAEEHGCDEEAREQARKPNLDKYLEEGARKIKEKLKEQEDKRKKKPKETKEKKK